MNTYNIYKPTYKPIDLVWYSLAFRIVGRVTAPTAEAAIKRAKQFGYYAPIVDLAKEPLQ